MRIAVPTSVPRTGRFRRTAVIAAGSAVFLAGCLPAPSSPKPTVISAELLNSPVVAGEQFTVRVVASHPAGVDIVTGASTVGPTGASLPLTQGTCNTATASVTPQPAVETTVDFTCKMPSYATNGEWTLTLWVRSNGYQATEVAVPFQLIGGSDDAEPPTIEVVTAPPPVVERGSDFEVGLRVTDEHLPLNGASYYPWPGTWRESAYFRPVPQTFVDHQIDCRDVVTTTLTNETVAEVSMSCPVDVDIAPGTYSMNFVADDQLGLRSTSTLTVVVV